MFYSEIQIKSIKKNLCTLKLRLFIFFNEKIPDLIINILHLNILTLLNYIIVLNRHKQILILSFFEVEAKI